MFGGCMDGEIATKGRRLTSAGLFLSQRNSAPAVIKMMASDEAPRVQNTVNP